MRHFLNFIYISFRKLSLYSTRMEPCSIYLFIIAELFSNMSTFYCAMSELFFITAIIYTNTSTMTEKWYGLGWWDWIQISIHAILCAASFF